MTPERVKEIVKLDREGKRPKELNEFVEKVEKEVEIGYSNVVGQDSLNRFEKSFTKRPNNKNRNKKKNNNFSQKSDNL